MVSKRTRQDDSEALEANERELALQERRGSDAAAESSGRLNIDVSVWKERTNHAQQAPGETWDEDVFGKNRPQICMLQTIEDPNAYLQAYFMVWTRNEAHIRVPVEDEDDRYEWVSLRSSRIWRGPMSGRHWTHIGRGLWKPKGQKKKSGKKRKTAPAGDLKPVQKYSALAEESEGPEDTEGAFTGARPDSRQTAISDSPPTPDSTAHRSWRLPRDEDLPEISQTTEPEEEPQENPAVDAPGSVVEGKNKEEEKAAWQRFMSNHFAALEQRGHVNLPWTAGCNWESGNLASLKPTRGAEEARAGLDSQASADAGEQRHAAARAESPRSDSMRVTLKDKVPKLHSSPRSTSPSTPHKAERGFRQQNSSSEDCDIRSAAANISPTITAKGVQVRAPNADMVSSPRSIGNAKAQQERGLLVSNADLCNRPDDEKEQNSGSSSSSGRAMQEVSPDTVLNGLHPEKSALAASQKGSITAGNTPKPQKGLKGSKPMQGLKQRLGPSAKQGKSPWQLPKTLPLKKRMKMALVETDPFNSALKS